MKRLFVTIVLCSLFILKAMPLFAEAQTKAVAITASSNGTSFILDNQGHVWAFTEPDEPSDLIQLPGLNDIKQIVPFGALRRDGRVFVWAVDAEKSKWIVDSDGNPLGRKSAYTVPKMVPTLNGVTDLEGMDYHFVAQLADGTIVQWGRPLNRPLLNNMDAMPPLSVLDNTPRKLIKIDGVRSIFVGSDNEAVLTDDGTAHDWGGAFAQFLPDTKNHPVDPEVMNVGVDARKIYITDSFVITLSADGFAHYWGKWNGEPSALNSALLRNWKDDVAQIAEIVPPSNFAGPIAYILRDKSVVLTPLPEYPCSKVGCMDILGAFDTQQLRKVYAAQLISRGVPDKTNYMCMANTLFPTYFFINDDGAIYADGREIPLISNETH